MRSKNIAYVPRIDHLRFLAAFLAMSYHFFTFQSFRYARMESPGQMTRNASFLSATIVEGHSGVSLFLVLSGFIFTLICYGHAIEYQRFIANRALRIMPLYMLVVGTAAIVTDADVGRFLSSALFLPSRGVFFEPLTPHLWTIAVEFQFYLLFPFLVRFLEKYGVTWGLMALVLMISLRFGLSRLDLGDWDIKRISYYTLVGRIDQFIVGMIAGAAYSGRAAVKAPRWMASTPALLFSFLLVQTSLYGLNRIGGYMHLPGDHVVWILWPTVDACCWALFVLCYLANPVTIPLSVCRALAALGTLSYSMYVFHWVFVHGVHYSDHLPAVSRNPVLNAVLTFTFIVLPMITALSWLSYVVLEQPFFSLRKSYLDRADHDVPALAHHRPA